MNLSQLSSTTPTLAEPSCSIKKQFHRALRYSLSILLSTAESTLPAWCDVSMKWLCKYGDQGRYLSGPIASSAHSKASRNLPPRRMLASRHRADRSDSSAKKLAGTEPSSRSMTAFHES